MIKKIIFTIGMIASSVVSVKAQKLEQHEIRVDWSDNFPITFTNLFSNALTDLFSGYSATNEKTIGLISIGYRYSINDRLSVGSDIGYASQSSDLEYNSNGRKEIGGSRKANHILVLPTAKFSYIKKGLFDFYGSASVGVIFSQSTDNYKNSSIFKSDNTGFAWQLNPAGLRIGKKIGGFIEVGAGYKGFVSLGANYKF